jgi:hypothetical protein
MISLGFLTLDIIILLAITAILFFLSLHRGKKVLARSILVFYPTTLLYLNLPYVTLGNPWSKVITYFLIFGIFFVLLKRNATAKKLYSNFRKTSDGLVLSVSVLILLLVLYYHVLPISTLYSISFPFSELITTKIPFGILMIIPILGLVITNKRDY